MGARWDGAGTNFSIFSEVAERVELCLFDHLGSERRIDLPERYALCWHGYVPGIGPGQRYGFRVHGPWDPDRGDRCDPSKLLLDPYAMCVVGNVQWNEAIFAQPLDTSHGHAHNRDSAAYVPRGVVIDPHFDWEGDRPPATPLHETMIYEVHVKGFTARHPDIPPRLRGTYAGLAHPAAVDYLRRLGVTAVELMPVHQFVHAQHLVDRGLRNYWGYDSIGFFAPHHEYSSVPEEQVREFKVLVKSLHAAGLEVILDVVYNHTVEGNHLGPVLSFKGIDNAAYYRLVPVQPRYYMDFTGTGNSLNLRHPHVLQMVTDSLRYWVQEMHIDGFRFDLASVLARDLHDVNLLGTFFQVIQQDPVISQVKLIAEPWDVGEGGYQVGNFPPLWLEWNGRYRDTMRAYWRGEDGVLGRFASRLVGSADLYADSGRRPFASVNFITAHDGFTLRDLVSYNEKHNDANGEANRDGECHNLSSNCGAEGPTDDPGVNAQRARQQRNFLATLFLSQGIPMLLAGDEIGRTQNGNNNGYCQDNELSWMDWQGADQELLAFVQRLIALRRAHPVLRRRRWLMGVTAGDVHDVDWFRPDGEPMNEEDWNAGFAKAIGVFFNGEAIPSRNVRGERITDDSFLLLSSAHHEPVDFRLPAAQWGKRWEMLLDSAVDSGVTHRRLTLGTSERIHLSGHSLMLLRRVE